MYRMLSVAGSCQSINNRVKVSIKSPILQSEHHQAPFDGSRQSRRDYLPLTRPLVEKSQGEKDCHISSIMALSQSGVALLLKQREK
jgi:hypothetical protein